jgi:hypothetical protein
MKHLIIISTFFFLFFSNAFAQKIAFPPTPNEDSIKGLNSNCYLAAIGHPSKIEKQNYINKLKPIIDSIASLNGIPQKTILAMAILESGCGYTRIGYYANNLFGLKKSMSETLPTYQLKGQPNENDGVIPIKSYGADRDIFKEEKRVDNRYKKFASQKECIAYLLNIFLKMKRYLPAIEKYKKNIANNVGLDEASLRYAFDIGEAGYFHLGGEDYRKKIEEVFKTLK